MKIMVKRMSADDVAAPVAMKGLTIGDEAIDDKEEDDDDDEGACSK